MCPRPTTRGTRARPRSQRSRADSSNCATGGLNPPEWVEWVDEPALGYPRRHVPRDAEVAKALRKRTLMNLYNARPQWLADAHVALDAAVAAAYGWPTDITDDNALSELLALNNGR